MDREAYLVLEALGRGEVRRSADAGRWIDAFKAVRWVVDGLKGPVLTAAGSQARDQLAAEHARTGVADLRRRA